jgi:hypothetical protein
MPAGAPRQVFRPSPPTRVIGWVVTAVFVLPGLVLALGGLFGGDWVGPEVTGVALLLLAAFCIRAMSTSVLVATPAELVYWDWMRRRSVGWTEIRSFRVGRGRSRGGWPAVIITLDNGTRIRTEVAAYRHRADRAAAPVRAGAPVFGQRPGHGADDRRAQRARAGRHPDRPVRTARPARVTCRL